MPGIAWSSHWTIALFLALFFIFVAAPLTSGQYTLFRSNKGMYQPCSRFQIIFIPDTRRIQGLARMDGRRKRLRPHTNYIFDRDQLQSAKDGMSTYITFYSTLGTIRPQKVQGSTVPFF